MVTVFPVDAKRSLIFKPNKEIKLKLYDTPLDFSDAVCSLDKKQAASFYGHDKLFTRMAKKRGVWAFCDEPNLTVHLWAKDMVYQPLPPDDEEESGDPISRDEERDAFGWIAAQSYRWAHAVKVHLAALSGGLDPRKDQP